MADKREWTKPIGLERVTEIAMKEVSDRGILLCKVDKIKKIGGTWLVTLRIGLEGRRKEALQINEYGRVTGSTFCREKDDNKI